MGESVLAQVKGQEGDFNAFPSLKDEREAEVPHRSPGNCYGPPPLPYPCFSPAFPPTSPPSSPPPPSRLPPPLATFSHSMIRASVPQVSSLYYLEHAGAGVTTEHPRAIIHLSLHASSLSNETTSDRA